MTKRTSVVVTLVVAGAVAVGSVAAIGMAQSGSRFDADRMRASFEVPAASSNARGSFEATLQGGTTVSYTLNYSGLESDVRQAHIHFAQTFASGGISVWLCETAQNPAPAAVQAVTPECPGPRAGEVNDTFNAAEVVGPATQGIEAMEFSALLAAMRSGLTYANVHSASIPGGEIRGQIKARGGGDDDDDDD
jgi:hypothetical protein